MTGPHLAEEEYWDEDGGREGGQQGVASIGEDGAIDMTGVGEFQVISISVLMSYIFSQSLATWYVRASFEGPVSARGFPEKLIALAGLQGGEGRSSR